MVRRLRQLYAKRIVNVNINVVVAGLLALGLTIIPVHFTRHYTDEPLAIMAVTFVSDMIFDVLIYFLLHWLANHMPHRRSSHPAVPVCVACGADLSAVIPDEAGSLTCPSCGRAGQPALPERVPELSFLRDATLIQFQRAVLSPVLYTVALGLQYTLLHQGIDRVYATLIGYGAGMLAARILHTIWMIRRGQV